MAQRKQQLPLAFMQRAIQVQFLLLPHWQAAARREGYERIEDAIIGIYRETGSLRKTAQRLTFSRRAIRKKLEALGEPINPPGGPNNPYGRAGKPRIKRRKEGS